MLVMSTFTEGQCVLGEEGSDSDSDKSLAVGGNVPAKVRKVRIQKWGGGCPQKNRIYI